MKLIAKTLTVLLVLGGSFSAIAQDSQPPKSDPQTRPEVLVVGVYHMSNPGRDVFNIQVDDVLSETRQLEIEQVIVALQSFQPSKIAVEASFHSQNVGKLYRDYVDGQRELSRNEVEQLGYRLGARLGHDEVFPVDVDGEFPYPRLVKFATATGRADEFNALQAQTAQMVESQGAYFASHTILENLLYLNADEHVAESMGWYFRILDFGEPWDWAGADLVSDWYRRNMRIYSNIARLIESPEERVLVIYGAGHLGWLRQAIKNNPDLRLRKLSEFVSEAPG